MFASAGRARPGSMHARFRHAVRAVRSFSVQGPENGLRSKADELWRLKWRKLRHKRHPANVYSGLAGALASAVWQARWRQSRRHCEYAGLMCWSRSRLRNVCALLAAFIGRRAH
jgi:hypothetical protein